MWRAACLSPYVVIQTGQSKGAQSCTKGITAPVGKEITLEFSRLDLDSSSDCLKIYDSDKADEFQVAAHWCGDMPNSNSKTGTPGKLVLHSGKAYFEWTTYKTSTPDGFTATWSFTDRPAASATAPSPICGGGVLTAGTGSLVDTFPKEA